MTGVVDAGARDGGDHHPAAPSILLPKGGGAIRGMGEKFAANPVTGTGSMSVPIATSPGRSGFGPDLSLSYDSGAGNGPFGFGWSLSLPSITRKTDKGLPQYRDSTESDTFILSGAEDLVPEFEQDEDGNRVLHDGNPVIHDKPRTIGEITYRVRRYRPRIEGLFARIERWTNTANGEIHWRSISKDNVTTVYGQRNESRIFDPADPDPAHPTRILSWLISWSSDDKGNAIAYGYKDEDSVRIFEDPSGNPLPKVHERNRTDQSRSAQRYLKRIRYGNRVPYLPFLTEDTAWPEPPDARTEDGSESWMFEIVFDYGEHDAESPKPVETGFWPARPDPFSAYRAGFEVRSYRLCRRVLMFHHFPDTEQEGVGANCLVRSTDFTYSDEVDPTDVRNPVHTFLRSVTQTGYRRRSGSGGYTSRRLPPVEFTYSEPVVQEAVQEVDPESLRNLPIGLDGSTYRWTDLHGEGISGILTEQGDGWFYKRNLSPLPRRLEDGNERVTARFEQIETVVNKPGFALAGGAELMDLAGDGLPDVVTLDGPAPGLFEHDTAEGWQPFRPFNSRLNRDLRDPNLRFVDLDGDGHSDILITEDNAFIWHPSLEEAGFGPARRVAQSLDEEHGPRIVFADGSQSIHLADFSGDGLIDIVRIRNGETCYWPNLGYGRFGAKVTMDHAPWFDHPDHFEPDRLRLADIDGSGTTDIIYLHRDGVRLYFNQSGNSWSEPRILTVFPHINDLAFITTVDLLGNGTACLVWSSPLPDDSSRAMRYVNLMGDVKPHLLVGTTNNLGAETRIDYAPSTKFYLQDKLDGKPWITRLPFPVHVVEKVTTLDHISRNRFISRYAYHHGYFDGEEREFRGFGMVERWDSEQIAALAGGNVSGNGIAAPSQVPPVRTKTWFHTGVYLDRDHVSDLFAGILDSAERGGYFREPGLTDEEFRALLLPDTVLPAGLSPDEEREACRALKGSLLRQEVYADDAEHPGATPAQVDRARRPYTVREQNFSIRTIQPRAGNRHAVFFTHANEAISYHYERNPADPRVQHALTLEVDDYGNVLKRATVGYGRRVSPLATQWDRDRQTNPLLTYTEDRVTNNINLLDSRRTPLPCESVTFELTGYAPTGPSGRFRASDFLEPDPDLPGRLRHQFTDEVAYEAPVTVGLCRRPIECLRTLYRRDDLDGLLPLGRLQPLGLHGESYKLAFTPGLLAQVFQRPRAGQSAESLLPDAAGVLGGQAGSRGGYLSSQTMKADGRFPVSDPDNHWWIPSGQFFFSDKPADQPSAELALARQHFFLPRRYRDPFGQDAFVDFDGDDLLMVETRDALDNRVTVNAHDYVVLQPRLVSDPNRNRTEVAFDVLGLVVGTAVMGKPFPAPEEGDSLTGFAADLTQAEIDAFFDPAGDPHALAPTLLHDATTRIVYDLDRFHRSRQAHPTDPGLWRPTCAATLARETHASDPLPAQGLKIQLGFSYSDGFGREIQKKIQAEPERVGGVSGPPRWVASGWTIFNNKGKPVRQYEPFFTATHGFEFGVQVGVSPVLFYDPADRVIATLHPNHTFEKVVFDPWQQTNWDVNDTCAARNEQTGDPRTDPDIGGYVAGYFGAQEPGWQTWHAQRIGGTLGPDERNAARRAASHADTPVTTHSDALGRPFLTVARNRVICTGHDLDGTEESFSTRIELDIEGNQRAVLDERRLPVNHLPSGATEQRILMRYGYDMLGRRIHQLSMESGERWILNDVAGKPIRAWDGRGHNFTTTYDSLRRQVGKTLRGTFADGPAASDPRTLNRDLLVETIEYGESLANSAAVNLRTRAYRHFDSAGVIINGSLDAGGNPVEGCDFKGNLLRSTRRLTIDYKSIPDWLLPAEPQLAAESFQSATRYDALNRPIQSVAPHSDLPGAKRNVIQPVFNEASLLERVDVWLERGTDPDTLLDTNAETPSPVGVANIDYDAKGRRQRIDYKNGASTFYTYDPLTFRLTRLVTRRNSVAFPGDDPQPPPDGWPGSEVQHLRYTYDPAGNINHLQDDAQQTVYFRNHRVEPSSDYTYDALYRLVQASGREHLGQAQGVPNPPSSHDALNTFPGRLAHPGDGNAMGTYIERFVHDAAGNILQMQHRGSDPAHAGWTRRFNYGEASLIEGDRHSNRLTNTQTGNGAASAPEPYQHDAHGNMVRMPHLGGGLSGPNLHWDYKDQLHQTDLGGGGAAWYVYDASGLRVRKVWEKAPGLTEERIYLGGTELFRKHGGPIGSDTATLERETLHAMDDRQRIALVETRTLDATGGDQAPRQLIRYQVGNHLGSASLELDEQAQIISYEEFAPYGSSTYQAVRSQTETAKRYRFTGKERDEESGLYYCSARYLAVWLGRWTASDPAGLLDGLNTYAYVAGNPVSLSDPSGRSKKDWHEVETEDPNATYYQNWTTGTVIRQGPGVREVWAERSGAAGDYIAVYQEYHFADDRLVANAVQPPPEAPHPEPPDVEGEAEGEIEAPEAESSGLETAADIVTDFIPIVGSGKDLYRGIRDGDPVGILFGVGGLALDVVTLGGGSLIKGGIKTGLKQGAKQLAKEGTEVAVKRATPSAIGTLVGTSKPQMRREAAKRIAATKNHPLNFLLDANGKLKTLSSRKHPDLINNPDVVEMGHIVSDKAGGVERIMLQSAWDNQFNNVTAEGVRRGGKNLGIFIENVAVDIGGVAVDLKTAEWWVREGFLAEEVLKNAPRLVF